MVYIVTVDFIHLQEYKVITSSNILHLKNDIKRSWSVLFKILFTKDYPQGQLSKVFNNYTPIQLSTIDSSINIQLNFLNTIY